MTPADHKKLGLALLISLLTMPSIQAQLSPTWVRSYPGTFIQFADMVADASGNVIVAATVTDSSGVDEDFVTLKYDSAGTLVWAIPHDSGGFDRAVAIAVDALGNTYVTGIGNMSNDNVGDMMTISYDPAGAQRWVALRDNGFNTVEQPTGIAVDGDGNVVVIGASVEPLGPSECPAGSADAVTLKYSSVGTLLWEQRFDEPHPSGCFEEGPLSVAVDPLGDIYLAGISQFNFSGVNPDSLVLKYSSDGALQWARRLDTSSSGDYARRIAVDGSGVYVSSDSAGFDGEQSTDYDILTMKLQPTTGGVLWTARFDSGAKSTETVADLALDPDGNVLVTGTSVTSTGTLDYVTLKYSAAGISQWVATYDGTGWDEATGLAVDATGHVYVTGFSAGNSFDIATVKYDPDGVQVDVALYDSGDWGDFGRGIALDGQGNVYVGGISEDFTQEVVTIRYGVGAANRAPVAEAGQDRLVETSSSGALVMLDGTASSDPDGDALTFTWTGPFGTTTGATPTVTLPLGTSTVDLTVSDGSATATDSVTITVRKIATLSIGCPPEVTAEAISAAGGPAFFVATASDTADPSPMVTYSVPPGMFPLGPTAVTATATNIFGETASCGFTVTVQDTTPPRIWPVQLDLATSDLEGQGYTSEGNQPFSIDTVARRLLIGDAAANDHRFFVKPMPLLPIGELSLDITLAIDIGSVQTVGEDTGVHVMLAEGSGLNAGITGREIRVAAVRRGVERRLTVGLSGGTFSVGIPVNWAVEHQFKIRRNATGDATLEAYGQTETIPHALLPISSRSTPTFGIGAPLDNAAALVTFGPIGHLTVQATSAAGAVVTYPTPTDAVDPAPTVDCTSPSGGTFPIGVTTVDCTMSDAAGNTSHETFTINVTPLPNQPPVNIVPGPQATATNLPLLLSASGGNPIAISDADANTHDVQVTLAATNGTLSLSNTTGLVFIMGDGSADVSMTFTGTIAAINTALDGMRFNPANGFQGLASLTITTDDQGHTGEGGHLSDTDIVSITVGPSASADLALTMTDSPDPVRVGSALTYTMEVKNNGPYQATTVTLVDLLPTGVTFVSATASQGSCTFVSANRLLRCDLGAMNALAVARVTLITNPEARRRISNVAGVVANQSDPNLANNVATVQTTVR